nr:methyltransferase domain-containing protein [Paenibacillus sp. F411]
MNWFPFNKDSSILEIGAGCGALTGLFCEKASNVVAVELTKKRAQINFERHRKYENLEIIVGDFNNIPIDSNFDYVIINGVLEYAKYMIDSQNPYRDFLVRSSAFLKDNGKMLLAIENRFGLKYFAGSKEDHTGEYFSGINGYIHQEKVRTFTKEELIEQIQMANLHAAKFYYPYPDYKFPLEIFTDQTVNSRFPTVPAYPLDMSRVKTFEEAQVYRSLMKMGRMNEFSNSFLVEISKVSGDISEDISYVKLSTNRNESFRICTYFNSSQTSVIKKATSPSAEKHILRMENYSNYPYDSGLIKNIDGEMNSKGLCFPFISRRNLQEELLEYASNEEQSYCISKIIHFRETLYGLIEKRSLEPSDEFIQIFGTEKPSESLRWRRNSNIDLIAGNIFLLEDSYQVIDYEWHINCETPLEFVLWRMLQQLVSEHVLLDDILKPTLIELVGINKETENCFKIWEKHFADEYVGIKNLHLLAKDTIPLDFQKTEIRQMQESLIHSTLFYDLGAGFSDSHYEISRADYTDHGLSVTFSKEQFCNVVKLRWDPLEGSASIIQILKVETDGEFEDVKPINADEILGDNSYKFFTFDPQFELLGNFSNASHVTIVFLCEILDWTEGYQKKEEENSITQSELEEVKTQYINTQNALKETEDQLQRAKATLDSKVQQVNELHVELCKAQEELEQMLKQMKEQRIKTAAKVLLYGRNIRRAKDE